MANFAKEYHGKFDAKVYLDKFYGESTCKEADNSAKKTIEILHREFSKEEHTGGGKLLDIGCGPTLHMAFCASKVYGEITLSEYVDCNREELTKWVNNAQDSFDWSKVLTYVGKMEDRDPKIIEDRTRKAIKEIIPVDMISDNIFTPNERGVYDCITSSLCLECCYKDIASFAHGFKKIASHLREGGVLFIRGIFGESYYKFGKNSFHYLNVSKEDVERSVTDAGFEIKELNVLDVDIDNWGIEDVSADGYGTYDLTAVKLSSQ